MHTISHGLLEENRFSVVHELGISLANYSKLQHLYIPEFSKKAINTDELA